jgi:hypothetical protein
MISASDKQILRQLAVRVAEIASLPVMASRRNLWVRHNRMEAIRPLVLVFPEGAWRELLPDQVLECQDKHARQMEWALRSRIYHHEHFCDDTVIESEWIVPKRITVSGWGLEPRHHNSPQATGSWAFDPVIRERADLARLRYPEVTVDEQGGQQDLCEAHELFDSLLDVKQKGVSHISFHLMSIYTGLRGLQQTFIDMVDNPAMLHEAMAFLTEGYRRMVAQYEEKNLLSLNNDSTYHSSGGVGYTDELPQPDCDPQHIRPCDMWSSAESQELDGVSPAMHEEFALCYERQLLAPFGLNGYGCCDRLEEKMTDVLKIPHIRRISIAPFANVERCAEQLGSQAIFSWKPHPAHLVGPFDADFVRKYVQHTIEVAQRHGCVLEMILKDTHTCEFHPERFTQWTEIASELAAQTM